MAEPMSKVGGYLPLEPSGHDHVTRSMTGSLRPKTFDRRTWAVAKSKKQEMKRQSPAAPKPSRNEIFPVTNPKRQPKRLTNDKRKKIQAFNDMMSSPPGGQSFAEMGSPKWISELVKFLNQPKHFQATRSDVAYWLKTSPGFFKMERERVARSHGPPPDSTGASLAPSGSENSTESDSPEVSEDSGVSSSHTLGEAESDAQPVTGTEMDGQRSSEDDVAEEEPEGLNLLSMAISIMEQRMADHKAGVMRPRQSEMQVESDASSLDSPGQRSSLSEVEENSESVTTELSLTPPRNPETDADADASSLTVTDTLNDQQFGPEPEPESCFIPAGSPEPETLQVVDNPEVGPTFPLQTTSDDQDQVSPDQSAKTLPIADQLPELIWNIDCAGDINSVLLYMMEEGSLPATLATLQFFTYLLAKLMEKAEAEGNCPETDLNHCRLLVEGLTQTLGGFPLTE